MTDLIRPEFEIIQDFMPVLFTSQFDEGLIKNELASLEAPVFHYKSIGFFYAQGHLNPK